MQSACFAAAQIHGEQADPAVNLAKASTPQAQVLIGGRTLATQGIVKARQTHSQYLASVSNGSI